MVGKRTGEVISSWRWNLLTAHQCDDNNIGGFDKNRPVLFFVFAVMLVFARR